MVWRIAGLGEMNLKSIEKCHTFGDVKTRGGFGAGTQKWAFGSDALNGLKNRYLRVVGSALQWGSRVQKAGTLKLGSERN